MRHLSLQVIATTAALAAASPAIAQARNWQQSTDSQTQLWVRDKNQGPPYQATFTVIEPNDKSVTLTVPSGRGDVTLATFPKDFGVFPPLMSGKYRWTATVNGKIAVSGDFNR